MDGRSASEWPATGRSGPDDRSRLLHSCQRDDRFAPRAATGGPVRVGMRASAGEGSNARVLAEEYSS
jgi:hypothetical protein